MKSGGLFPISAWITLPWRSTRPIRSAGGNASLATSLRAALRPFTREQFKAGNDIEELLVDAALAKTVIGPIEALEQVVDVSVRTLHRGQPASVLAGQRLGAGPEERDEEILPNQRVERRGNTPEDIGPASVGPGNFGEALIRGSLLVKRMSTTLPRTALITPALEDVVETSMVVSRWNLKGHFLVPALPGWHRPPVSRPGSVPNRDDPPELHNPLLIGRARPRKGRARPQRIMGRGW